MGLHDHDQAVTIQRHQAREKAKAATQKLPPKVAPVLKSVPPAQPVPEAPAPASAPSPSLDEQLAQEIEARAQAERELAACREQLAAERATHQQTQRALAAAVERATNAEQAERMTALTAPKLGVIALAEEQIAKLIALSMLLKIPGKSVAGFIRGCPQGRFAIVQADIRCFYGSAKQIPDYKEAPREAVRRTFTATLHENDALILGIGHGRDGEVQFVRLPPDDSTASTAAEQLGRVR